jgi:hypothetical protein
LKVGVKAFFSLNTSKKVRISSLCGVLMWLLAFIIIEMDGTSIAFEECLIRLLLLRDHLSALAGKCCSVASCCTFIYYFLNMDLNN